ncbi:DUF899 domain-containing protein [Maritalea myrionectae]|uniref:DUF899 domain-containing protein n=1 Tax=Maritalea myrionectae TaxID=454601 RepID=UPI0004292A07|nr:DUF899 domain-containing protein [Maritalea myrionectae]
MDKRVVERQEWLKARQELLAREKELMRLQDEVAAARRKLPFVKLDKDYAFETVRGPERLEDLFGPHDQLLIYHFMYGPDWEAGCPSCSFWADSFDGNDAHFAARNVAFKVVSRGPLDRLQAYRKRMGWRFDWVSAASSPFNFDFGVSFEEAQPDKQYNYRPAPDLVGERPGISAFYKDDEGIYHTYSTFGRGVEPVNSVYAYLDMAPKGRDEAELDYTMAWVRRRDEYGA